MIGEKKKEKVETGAVGDIRSISRIGKNANIIVHI